MYKGETIHGNRTKRKAPLTLHRTTQTDAKRMKKYISVRPRSRAFVIRFLSAECGSRTVMSVFYGEQF